MTLIPSAELDRIKSDVNAIIQDTSIGTTVKYRQFTGQDYFDVEKQGRKTSDDIYTDWSGVSVIKSIVTRQEAEKIGEGVEIGDTKFTMMQSSVSNTLSVSDVVVESGVTYNVKKITLDSLGIVYLVFAEAM